MPTPDTLVISHMGEVILTLTGGNVLLIGMTYLNMGAHGDHRAQDFLHGVLCGVNHVAMTGVPPGIALPTGA